MERMKIAAYILGYAKIAYIINTKKYWCPVKFIFVHLEATRKRASN